MTAHSRLLCGRYQIGDRVGSGGMADVYHGRDLRLGRYVAVKVLRSSLAGEAEFLERFRREAQNAAALKHPAIAEIYDAGEDILATGGQLPFIVMEFVNGWTLRQILHAERRIPVRRALEITADICAALEFSHRHGIIHRDMKPGNVMLTRSGQVKVMDFGLAYKLGATITQRAQIIGTAQYISPEQARGEPVDARSDVYSVGCLLFELLTGGPPFSGDSPLKIAYRHVLDDPPVPSAINPKISALIDAVVLRALAKNLADRYQSARELRSYLLGAGGSGAPSGEAGRSRPP